MDRDTRADRGTDRPTYGPGSRTGADYFTPTHRSAGTLDAAVKRAIGGPVPKREPVGLSHDESHVAPLTNGGTDRLVPLTAPNPADAFDYPQDYRSWLTRYPESVLPFEDIFNTLQHRARSGCTLTDQCDACNDGHWD